MEKEANIENLPKEENLSTQEEQKEKSLELPPLPEPKGKCPVCKAELGFMGWCANCKMKMQ